MTGREFSLSSQRVQLRFLGLLSLPSLRPTGRRQRLGRPAGHQLPVPNLRVTDRWEFHPQIFRIPLCVWSSTSPRCAYNPVSEDAGTLHTATTNLLQHVVDTLGVLSHFPERGSLLVTARPRRTRDRPQAPS